MFRYVFEYYSLKNQDKGGTMTFNTIDMQTWNRNESYSHYFNTVPCTYSMTVNLDVTEFIKILKENKLKFFPAILYGISHIVNSHEEFRMDFDENKKLGYHTFSNPCYAIFHNETETFTNVWTEYNADFTLFMQNYTIDMAKYQKDFKNSKPLSNKNHFNVSCIPWTNFTGFNLNLQQGYDYLAPIFTIGKYVSSDDKIEVPLAIQVHHAVCDGFHLSRFINELQNWINNPIL